ncbi:flagellar basal body protein, partial [Streptomyces sp. SID12501]|nr:flagellar basal-body rod protein FlgC [Streptomyces sp. SID12501]
MTIFGAIGVAGTGMTVTRKWMDAVGDNIANANTVTATSE